MTVNTTPKEVLKIRVTFFFETMQIEQAIQFINHPEISTGEVTRWADFGAGSGLFTNALASLLSPGSKILAIDKNIKNFEKRKNDHAVIVEIMQHDFTGSIDNLKDLDGILMANSLHFIPDKLNFIDKCRNYFKHRSRFLFVEYDTNVSNPWVPYPVSFSSLRDLIRNKGFHSIEKIYEASSRYNRAGLYSALVKE